MFDVDETDENEDTSDTEFNSEDQVVDINTALPGFENVAEPEQIDLIDSIEEQQVEEFDEVTGEETPIVKAKDTKPFPLEEATEEE